MNTIKGMSFIDAISSFLICLFLGLPAFFQSGGKTVLDELANDELENQNGDDLLDSLIDDAFMNNEEINEDTFTDAFGDLKVENLPEYFVTPSKGRDEEESDDIDMILSKSYSDRLQDQANSLAIHRQLDSSPSLRMTGLPPGLTPNNSIAKKSLISPAASSLSTPMVPPGMKPPPMLIATPNGLNKNNTGSPAFPSFQTTSAPPSASLSKTQQLQASLFGTPLASKVHSVPSVTPGLIPMNSLIPPSPSIPSTPGGGDSVSVVSSILSPPPLTANPNSNNNGNNTSSPAQFFTQKPNYGRGKLMTTSDVR
jgi:hypothetical protein